MPPTLQSGSCFPSQAGTKTEAATGRYLHRCGISCLHGGRTGRGIPFQSTLHGGADGPNWRPASVSNAGCGGTADWAILKVHSRPAWDGDMPNHAGPFLPGSADRGEEAAEGGLSFGGVGEGAGILQDVREDLAGLPRRRISRVVAAVKTYCPLSRSIQSACLARTGSDRMSFRFKMASSRLASSAFSGAGSTASPITSVSPGASPTCGGVRNGMPPEGGVPLSGDATESGPARNGRPVDGQWPAVLRGVPPASAGRELPLSELPCQVFRMWSASSIRGSGSALCKRKDGQGPVDGAHLYLRERREREGLLHRGSEEGEFTLAPQEVFLFRSRGVR